MQTWLACCAKTFAALGKAHVMSIDRLYPSHATGGDDVTGDGHDGCNLRAKVLDTEREYGLAQTLCKQRKDL
jgi:hypothetical protein